MTQKRTPDEKEITKRTDKSIEKLIRLTKLISRVAAQNKDISRKLNTEDEWPLSLGGVYLKHNFNLTSVLIGLFFIYFLNHVFYLRRVSLEVKFIRNDCALFSSEISVFSSLYH